MDDGGGNTVVEAAAATEVRVGEDGGPNFMILGRHRGYQSYFGDGAERQWAKPT